MNTYDNKINYRPLTASMMDKILKAYLNLYNTNFEEMYKNIRGNDKLTRKITEYTRNDYWGCAARARESDIAFYTLIHNGKILYCYTKDLWCSDFTKAESDAIYWFKYYVTEPIQNINQINRGYRGTLESMEKFYESYRDNLTQKLEELEKNCKKIIEKFNTPNDEENQDS